MTEASPTTSASTVSLAPLDRGLLILIAVLLGGLIAVQINGAQAVAMPEAQTVPTTQTLQGDAVPVAIWDDTTSSGSVMGSCFEVTQGSGSLADPFTTVYHVCPEGELP